MNRHLFTVHMVCIMYVLAFACSLQAQDIGKGTITGNVVDGSTGEDMVGAVVRLDGTRLGAVCDIEGKFVIPSVPVGTYTVIAGMVGYSETRIDSVIVGKNKTVTLAITINPEAFEVKEVTVKARAIQETEASVLKERQESEAVTDAVSAEAISKAGGSNVADAMKQVTGTTVVEGKSVVVRGLGDRYMNIQLNGSELPSTSQYNQTVQVDLFPSNLISNIVTQKTFTPDKPGSFTGGAVNIETKSFPEKPTLTVSLGTSYNPQSNLTGDYLTYNAGTTWTGTAGEKIEIPGILADPDVEIPRATVARRDKDLAYELDSYSKVFNNTMKPSNGYAGLNQSYAVSLGNQYKLFGSPLGILGSLSYARSFVSYDDGYVGLWKLTDPKAPELSEYMQLTDYKSTEDVLWGGLLDLAYRFNENHKIGINSLVSQNGEKTARILSGTYRENISVDRTFEPNVLSYNDRFLRTIQFSGDHKFPGLAGIRVEWRHSSSKTSQNEPDLRYFTYTYNTEEPDNPNYNLYNNYFQRPTRTFRKLTESTGETGADISVPFKFRNEEKNSIKFGGQISRKERSFVQRQFEYQKPDDKTNIIYTGDSADYFSESHLGLIDSTKTPYVFGLTIIELKYPSSLYNGNQNIDTGYGMIDIGLTSKLRFIGGLRYEATDMSVENPETKGTVKVNDTLPSVNLVYELISDMNLRLAWSRTVARPTIREMAPYATYDFGAGAFVVGNPDLKRTLITNYDIRWEWFFRTGEVLSASLFVKDMKNPIERVIVDYDGQTTFSNVEEARVTGLELETRSALDLLHSSLANYTVGANCTFVKSVVDIPEEEMVFIRAYNPDAGTTRPFMGQSPYIFNLDFSYDNQGMGVSSTLFYNIYGRRLSENSLGGTPDVYEKPFPTLNYSFSKNLSSHVRLKMSAKNLLDAEEKKVQDYRGEEFFRSRSGKGRSYSVNITYSL
ncbi:TonB-dependent receptor [bacterium]|nr:TonB-dependent receptor [bacterium]